MNNTYTELVQQTLHLPQEGFDVNDNNTLLFNGVDIQSLVDKYGTPFKLTYLPKIGMLLQKVKKIFNDAIRKLKYELSSFPSWKKKKAK